jgi:hypothetical protein
MKIIMHSGIYVSGARTQDIHALIPCWKAPSASPIIQLR